MKEIRLPEKCEWKILNFDKEKNKYHCLCTRCNETEGYVGKWQLERGRSSVCKRCSSKEYGKSKQLILDIDKSYGLWKILDPKAILINKVYKYHCECTGCGRKYFVIATSINTGKSNGCRSCTKLGVILKKDESQRDIKIFTKDQLDKCSSVGDFNRTTFLRYKYRATRLKRDFELDMEDIWNLYLKQGGKCTLSGEHIIFDREHGRTQENLDQTVSLDRKDSSKGYIIENVQLVHKTVNTMKSDLLDNEFIFWCSLIKLNSEKSPKIPFDYKFKVRPKTFKGYKDIPLDYFNNLKRSAKHRRDISFDISPEMIWNQFEKQGFRCALTGLPIRFSPEINASVDRINSNISYISDNIQLVHKTVNRIKWTLSTKELTDWATKITLTTTKGITHNVPTTFRQ